MNLRARLKSQLPMLLTGAIFLASCSATDTRVSGTEYGDPITLTDTTLVSTILANPASFVGEKVLVTGVIVAVCESRGCWMEVASDSEYEKIKIKVDDGVIVFPTTARGLTAVVEGVVEELELTAEQALERLQHMAEERGLPFDSTTITGPEKIYQIRGHGAFIAD